MKKDFSTGSTTEKIQNLKEIEYYANYNFVGQILLKLKMKYPDNKKIKECVHAMTEVGFFANEMIANQRHFDLIVSEYRGDKLRAIQRARRAEEELQKYKEKFSIK